MEHGNFKFLFLLAFTMLVFSVKANFSWVEIGVNGLTCSQCTKSVEMSIRKLEFVSEVEMNLEHTQGRITFKPGAKVDLLLIAKAVVDAGFSVRYLHAAFVFENVPVSNGHCFAFDGRQYQFVKTDSKTLHGETILKLKGKNFLPAKEYKQWKSDLSPVCNKSKGEILYVTL